MGRLSILAVVIALCTTLGVHGQSTSASQGSNDHSSSMFDSVDRSLNKTIGFFNILTANTQKSYFVGLRPTATDANICYGVLISPTHVLTSGCKQNAKWSPKWNDWLHTSSKKEYTVIGSRYNSGSHDDGSETIKISDYDEHTKYSNTGYRALGIYELETPSKLTPVKLPDSEIVDLPQNTSLTTYGWANVNSDYVMTERILQSVSVDMCGSQQISFQDCICTVTTSAADGCDIINGSPLIMKQGTDEILIGLRYTIKEACGISGFPVAFTSFAGALAWAKKSNHNSWLQNILS